MEKIIYYIKKVLQILWYISGIGFIVALVLKWKPARPVKPIKPTTVNYKPYPGKQNISKAALARQAMREFEEMQ